MLKRRKSRRGKRIADVISNAYREAFSDDMIEIHYDRLALITGCRRITEYSDSRLRLQFKNRSAIIEGTCLVPESLVNGQMAVKGNISRVVFEND